MIDKYRWYIAAGITITTVMVIGFLVWLIIALQPVDRNSTEVVSFPLKSGTSATELADQLRQKDLIRSAKAFSLFVTITGKRRGLEAGDYELSQSQSSAEIAETLNNGYIAQTTLVVPEGITTFKIRDLATEKGIPISEFDAALTSQYTNDFLKGRPSGNSSLEGYLFPDSYQVVKPPRARAIVQNMLDNFASKVGGTDIPQKFSKLGLSFHQGVTLASIVEREVKTEEDRAVVAQLYINRLKAGMPLQADPTAIYAAELTGRQVSPAEAIKINSPYNTYMVRGLPPGPIGNPGLSSLKATANPKPNDYLYFLSGKDGKTHFARTLEEHQQNINKYLN